MNDALELADPEALEPERRAAVRERFLYRVGSTVAMATVYLNLFGGVVLSIALNWSQAVSAAVLVVGIGAPVAALIAVNTWKSRRVRAVGDAVRTRLGIAKKGGRLWTLFVLAGLVGVVGIAATGGQQGLTILFVCFGIAFPALRWFNDRRTPAWVLAVMSGWMFSGAVLMVGLRGWIGDAVHPLGIFWLLAAPGGLFTVLIRAPWGRAMVRDDGIGRLARSLAPLLPPAQRARAARLRGDPDDARTLLVDRFSHLQGTAQMGEALLELAEVEPDPALRRAWLAGACRLLPDGVEPFAAVARSLETSEPATALGYAIFAEANASRTIGSDVAAFRALRERLEASG